MPKIDKIQLQEAVDVMTELFNLMSSPKIIKVDSKAYDRRNALSVLLQSAQAVLSGEGADLTREIKALQADRNSWKKECNKLLEDIKPVLDERDLLRKQVSGEVFMGEEEVVDKIAEWINHGNVWEKEGDIMFSYDDLCELAKHLTRLPKLLSVSEIEKIIKYFKDNKCPYGINWCANEAMPREPNSIGTCDYCGRPVRLKTLAEVLKNAMGGE
jgi:predicted methyltransferase